VLTLPPEAPPPAASTAAAESCPGDPGELNAQGLPVDLPTRIQVGGVAYLFGAAEAPADVGALTRIGCAGPFELTVTDGADQADVIYLSAGPGGPHYRFDAALTFEVQFEASEQPQTITAFDQRYRLERAWRPSVYSSASVILFVEDPAASAPTVVYGLNVTQSAMGGAVGEYRSVEESTQPSAELAAAAEQAGLNPDLVINGVIYVLADVFTPAGTTRNGFMTLFASTTAEGDQVLLGRDPRDVELFVFVLEVPVESQG
jgi:hypothetical protein